MLSDIQQLSVSKTRGDSSRAVAAGTESLDSGGGSSGSATPVQTKEGSPATEVAAAAGKLKTPASKQPAAKPAAQPAAQKKEALSKVCVSFLRKWCRKCLSWPCFMCFRFIGSFETYNAATEKHTATVQVSEFVHFPGLHALKNLLTSDSGVCSRHQ